MSEAAKMVLHLVSYLIHGRPAGGRCFVVRQRHIQLAPDQCECVGLSNESGWVRELFPDGDRMLHELRSGVSERIIEAVRVVSLSSGTEHLALSDKFTEPVVRAAEAYMDLYQRLEIEPPFTLMFALLGVKGFSIRAEGMFPDECCAFDRDELLFPETIVDDLGQPAESWLGPLFDMVWQASGFLCMPRRA
jgi:hypothetical protein